jgi:hypothetical protein
VICDYIYTEEGLRAQSGSVAVKLSWPDGTVKTLSVVRSGKGRSRIDRWEANPRLDGVTGEINTRDLQDWMKQNGVGEIEGVLNADGVSLKVSLERDALMGRAGRRHALFGEYLDGLGEIERTAAALLMLKNMPYGLENTEDFRERAGASLRVLDDENIKKLLESGNFNFLGHCSDAELVELVKSHFGIISSIVSSIDGVGPETISRIEQAVAMSKSWRSLAVVVENVEKYGEELASDLYCQRQDDVYMALLNADLPSLQAAREVCVRMMHVLHEQYVVSLLRSQENQRFWLEVLLEARGNGVGEK